MQKTISVIDLGAIENNVKILKNIVGGRKFYAVVKADAYGHGAERVSLHIEPLVDGFCVALTEEGVALRVAGVTKPILVLTPLSDADDALAAAYYNLSVTVNSRQSARLAAGLCCHIKVNTGMNRYGCSIGELKGVLNALDKSVVEGVYSHLYRADIEACRREQLRLFNEAESIVKAAYPCAISHISASGGAICGGEFLKDAVRCGIAIYGYAPQGFELKGLKRALSVYARRVQTCTPVGGGAGYALAQKNYSKLSAYRAGYADGFLRTVPLGEGNLCMDAFISEQERDLLPIMKDADEYAAKCGTISYEVLCSVTRRSQRIYKI